VTSIERTAYPRLKRYFTPLELAKFYTPTSSEKKFALANTRIQEYKNTRIQVDKIIIST